MRGGLIAVTAAIAVSALLAPTARAAVVTYASADVPKAVADGTTVSSAVSLPDNRPPATDIDLVGVRVSSGAGSYGDRSLLLSPVPDRLFYLAHACSTAFDFDLGWDDSAPTAFTPPGDCSAMGITRHLGLNAFLEPDAGNGKTYAKGTWRLVLEDGGAGGVTAPPSTLQRWALRVSYEPMTFTAEAEKQKLKKTLELTAKCSADCRVSAQGDARGSTFVLNADKSTSLRVALKKKAKRRLAKRGKAKIELEASSDIGDVLQREVSVRIDRRRR